MKKLIALFLVLFITVSLSGCGHPKAEPDYKKELTDLGFYDPQDTKLVTKTVVWSVAVSKDTSVQRVPLLRAIDGSWFYSKPWAEDVSTIEEFCDNNRSGMEFAGWVTDTLSPHPMAEVKVYNRRYTGYNSWHLVKKGAFGRGYFLFSKNIMDKWVPAPYVNYSEPNFGYIPNISLAKLKSEAVKYYKMDPPESDSTLGWFPYSTVWDFEKGGLKE